MIDLEEIRSRYGPLIWNTVYRVLRDHADSLDCYQDVFCEVLERTSRAEKGTGPICAKPPEGRSGKLDLSPFPPERQEVEDWPGYLRWLATHNCAVRSYENMNGIPFNPEPAATAFGPRSSAIAAGSGLNERKTDWPCDRHGVDGLLFPLENILG
jgi:hypothetical protein